MIYQLTAPCHFGLEKTLGFEIRRAGGEITSTTDGRVNFKGDAGVIARANITCSVAERIGIVLATFTAKTFDDVFFGAQKINLEDFVGKNDKFPVTKGHSLNSVLTSIPALQRTLKKGLVLRMQEKHKTTDLSETGVNYPIQFLLFKDVMTVILDTSGEGLHKRGYRAMSNAAPIKETLAAGIVDLAHIRDTDTIIDPFCGSGTILIEAAFKALNIAPCLNRTFQAMEWDIVPKKIWEQAFDEARAKIKTESGFVAYGYDIDSAAAELTKSNAWKAGVQKHIEVSRRAIADFKKPENPFVIITNPPYAERMGEKEEAEEIYRTMGKVLLPLGDSRMNVITSHPDFEKLFGEKAAKNRKLYNGMIMCRLFSY